MDDLNTPATTQLSQSDVDALRGTAKWARFLSIVGFVMIGLMVIMGLFFGSMFATLGGMSSSLSNDEIEQLRAFQELEGMEGMEGVDFDDMRGTASTGMATVGVIYTALFLVMAAIYFVPTLMLYKFSSSTLRSLTGTFDSTRFTSGLNSHRRMYKFMGILMIVLLSLYLLMFIAGGLAAIMMI